jgi:hypothetical protein
VSDDELYRVLYTDADGHEQLTGAMPLDAARSRAKALQEQGYAVGSVMGDVAARGYMHARYAPTYRGVDIPLDLRADGVPRSAFEAWKRGVDAELDAPKPADQDYNHELRTRALSLPEAALRRAVDRLLEQCGREEVHQVPGSPRAEMLHTSEIYMVLGLRGPDLSALERVLNEDNPLRGPACSDPGCPAGYPHHGPCPGEEDR